MEGLKAHFTAGNAPYRSKRSRRRDLQNGASDCRGISAISAFPSPLRVYKVDPCLCSFSWRRISSRPTLLMFRDLQQEALVRRVNISSTLGRVLFKLVVQP